MYLKLSAFRIITFYSRKRAESTKRALSSALEKRSTTKSQRDERGCPPRAFSLMKTIPRILPETPNLSRDRHSSSLGLPLSRELVKSASDRYDLHEIKATRSSGVIFAAHERKRRKKGREEGGKSRWYACSNIPRSQNLLSEKLFRNTGGRLQGDRISGHSSRCYCINADVYIRGAFSHKISLLEREG